MDRGAALGVWYGMAGCLLCLVLVICRLGLLRLKLLLGIKEAALGCYANADRGLASGLMVIWSLMRFLESMLPVLGSNARESALVWF